jgi:hypothetical protein
MYNIVLEYKFLKEQKRLHYIFKLIIICYYSVRLMCLKLLSLRLYKYMQIGLVLLNLILEITHMDPSQIM